MSEEDFWNFITYCGSLVLGEVASLSVSYFWVRRYLDVDLFDTLRRFMAKRRRNLFVLTSVALLVLLPIPMLLVNHLDVFGIYIVS